MFALIATDALLGTACHAWQAQSRASRWRGGRRLDG
jgi:hypothetical protein